jgi:hypothetical protein
VEVTKQSLLERVSDLVPRIEQSNRLEISRYLALRPLYVLALSSIRLLVRARAKKQGRLLRECVWAEAGFASHCIGTSYQRIPHVLFALVLTMMELVAHEMHAYETQARERGSHKRYAPARDAYPRDACLRET